MLLLLTNLKGCLINCGLIHVYMKPVCGNKSGFFALKESEILANVL